MRSKARKSYRPTCEALEDRKLLYSVATTGWVYPTRITYSFIPDGTSIGGTGSNLYSSLSGLGVSNWKAAIRKAAATWQAATGIEMVEVSDDGEAIGTTAAQQGDIKFGDIRIGGEAQSMNQLAFAFLSPNYNGGSDAGDFFFNTSQSWQTNGTTYDLMTVAIHEFGHALGLGHSTDASQPCMWAGYGGSKETLYTDDINGIRAIYGNPASDSDNGVWNTVTFSGGVASGTNHIVDNNDIDWYYFTAPSTGTMTIKMVSSSLSSLSPVFSVYDTSYNYLTGGTASGYGDTAICTLSVTQGTTYYVAAGTSKGAGSPGNSGNYGLVFNMAPPAIVSTTVADSSTSYVSAALGTNGHIVANRYSTSTGLTNWLDLGAPTGVLFSSNPTSITWGNGSGEIWARASDGNVYEQYYNGWTFYGWTNIGKPGSTSIAGYPFETLDPDGSGITVFVVGADGQLWQNYAADNSTFGGWSAAGSGGKTLVGSATAWTTGSTFKEAYVRASDGTLEQAYYNGSTWTFGNLTAGQALAGNPTLAIDSSNHRIVTGVSTSGNLDTFYWNGSSWSNGQRGNPGTALMNQTATTVMYSSGDYVYVNDTSGKLWMAYSSNGTSWTFYDEGKPSAGYVGSPSAATYGGATGNHQLVSSLGQDGSMYSNYWNNASWSLTNWQSNPMTMLGQNPLTIPNTYVAAAADNPGGSIVSLDVYDLALSQWEHKGTKSLVIIN